MCHGCCDGDACKVVHNSGYGGSKLDNDDDDVSERIVEWHIKVSCNIGGTHVGSIPHNPQVFGLQGDFPHLSPKGWNAPYPKGPFPSLRQDETPVTKRKILVRMQNRKNVERNMK